MFASTASVIMYRLRNKSGAVFYFCFNCVNALLICMKICYILEQSKLYKLFYLIKKIVKKLRELENAKRASTSSARPPCSQGSPGFPWRIEVLPKIGQT